jgi:hypothetical protein
MRRAKPSVAFATRVDLDTDECRRRLQQRTGLSTPDLLRQAMRLFEERIETENCEAQVR